MKSRLFIGSASKDLEIAYAIQNALSNDYVEVTVWTQGTFELTSNLLDDLFCALEEADFGVFVLSATDTATIRNEQVGVARDNVIFELGLFLGRLGKKRTFLVTPKEPDPLHLPSDLAGVNTATFEADREDGNLDAALGLACHQITQRIKKLGFRKARLAQPDVRQVNKPTVLCASSSQYAHFGFDRDAEIVSSAFPGQVTVEMAITSTRLKDLLLYHEHRFDIVHLAGFIDIHTGDFVFDEIDIQSQRATADADKMSPQQLARLLEFSKTSLVVLATCESLSLAVELARVTNVVAARHNIDVPVLLDWEKRFYRLLAQGQPISTASEIAKSASGAPVSDLLRSDVSFAL